MLPVALRLRGLPPPAETRPSTAAYPPPPSARAASAIQGLYPWSRSKALIARLAAFCPDMSMAPNVGPMRLHPRTSATSIPAKMSPGTTSVVMCSTASSAVAMSMACIPGSPAGSAPIASRRLAEVAPIGPSWPVAVTTTFASITWGSMQDWVSWFCVTSDQFVTTPRTRTPSSSCRTSKSSTATALNSFVLSARRAARITEDMNNAACLTTT
mmetsp:Transcript_52622/g.159952  ORF Transcript_52622/g.159952 Transcript_52622/m.159952 type:complete len:213 (-) Transcript_52622:234-872(-)